MKGETKQSVELSDEDLAEIVAAWCAEKLGGRPVDWQVTLGTTTRSTDMYERDSKTVPHITASRTLAELEGQKR